MEQYIVTFARKNGTRDEVSIRAENDGVARQTFLALNAGKGWEVVSILHVREVSPIITRE